MGQMIPYYKSSPHQNGDPFLLPHQVAGTLHPRDNVQKLAAQSRENNAANSASGKPSQSVQEVLGTKIQASSPGTLRLQRPSQPPPGFSYPRAGSTGMYDGDVKQQVSLQSQCLLLPKLLQQGDKIVWTKYPW